MSERNDGLRSLLSVSWIYETFQNAVGQPDAHPWLLENLWKIRPGMTVVDVGCGPARLRALLPEDIHYFGFDPNPSYIAKAKSSLTGNFTVGVMPDFLEHHGAALLGKVDAVLCSGVLHHLTRDQMAEVLEGGRRLLKPGGRFLAIEPCYLVRQDPWSRWVINRDRGCNILHDHEWRSAFQAHFGQVDVRVANHLLRIPYMHSLITGSNV